MTLPEETFKRLETLTRATKLLGKQYREQKKQIAGLQEELAQIRVDIAELKEKFLLKPPPAEMAISQTEKVNEIAKESVSSFESPQEKSETLLATEASEQEPDGVPLEQDSEKRDLLEALKKIDNL
ncbi:MAG: hypothetical protein ACFE95_19430 [Candidatus Hodarchaeota archaeon]